VRPRLFGIAYRLPGSAAEAEDVVQAFLVTVATRLSIDRLRSARAPREQYVGT
jgi:RNA polymerase sigma-70 factor, ECF subfamily